MLLNLTNGLCRSRSSRAKCAPSSTVSIYEELDKEELHYLSGYRNSSPVRVGNGIYNQLQLVLYVAVLDAVYLYNKYGAPLDYEVWQIL